MLKKEGRLEAKGRGAFYASTRLGNYKRVVVRVNVKVTDVLLCE